MKKEDIEIGGIYQIEYSSGPPETHYSGRGKVLRKDVPSFVGETIEVLMGDGEIGYFGPEDCVQKLNVSSCLEADKFTAYAKGKNDPLMLEFIMLMLEKEKQIEDLQNLLNNIFLVGPDSKVKFAFDYGEVPESYAKKIRNYVS